VQISFNSTARYFAPRFSGDDKRIAFGDSRNRLHVIDIAGKKLITIATDPAALAMDHRWSPDGQYLAYSQNDEDGIANVYIWSALDGKSRRVTPLHFKCSFSSLFMPISFGNRESGR
jgi:Tol biopolymer transport system component